MSRSHISELISSRTCEAFSRAPAMQETIDGANLPIRRQPSDGNLRILIAGIGGQPEPGQRAIPALIVRELAAAQHQAVRRFDRARAVVRALEVAAHPVEAVGDSGKHDLSALEDPGVLAPPPCDELTTSEPLRSATRVSPPGTIVVFSPKST